MNPVGGFLVVNQIWNSSKFIIEYPVKLWANVTCVEVKHKGDISSIHRGITKIDCTS